MSMKGFVRSVAIGAVLYGGAKVVEFVGICKGIVYGCRAAATDPEAAKQVADDWDDLKLKWENFKNKKEA